MTTSMENTSAHQGDVVLDVQGLTVTLSSDGRRNRVVDEIDLTDDYGDFLLKQGKISREEYDRILGELIAVERT